MDDLRFSFLMLNGFGTPLDEKILYIEFERIQTFIDNIKIFNYNLIIYRSTIQDLKEYGLSFDTKALDDQIYIYTKMIPQTIHLDENFVKILLIKGKPKYYWLEIDKILILDKHFKFDLELFLLDIYHMSINKIEIDYKINETGLKKKILKLLYSRLKDKNINEEDDSVLFLRSSVEFLKKNMKISIDIKKFDANFKKWIKDFNKKTNYFELNENPVLPNSHWWFKVNF